jgi:hypothetical protein
MADKNQNISEVLYQAHQSIHGSYTDQPVSVNTVQVNNNDQTFTCNSNIPVQCPTQTILHSTLLLGLPHGQLHHAHMGFVPPPGPADVQITPQMIFSNINDTNQRLELSMHERLSKLDMLDTLNLKLEHFEKKHCNY